MSYKDKPVKYLEQAIKDVGAKGGILILQTDDGNKITQIGLTPEEIIDNLCIAIYYAKSIEFSDDADGDFEETLN